MRQDSEEPDSGFYKAFFNEGIYKVNELTQTTEAKAEDAGKDESLPIQGNINSKTLVLVNYPAFDEFPAIDKEYLSKILAAVKISFGDVAWLNLAKAKDATWQDIENMHHEVILGFGVTPKIFPDNIAFNSLAEGKGNKLFLTEDLRTLKESTAIRSLLWEALKKIYL